MIDHKASDQDQLKAARDLFCEAVEHYEDARGEMHRAARFFHNSKLEGQWETDDLQVLRDEGRPAFSFNMIAPKIRTWQGQYHDGKRRPMVVPKGGEDKTIAEVLERVCDAVYSEQDVDSVDEAVLEGGIVRGEMNWHVNVVPDPDQPGMVLVEVTSVSGNDVMWDPSSSRTDRQDAGHFFWSKWLRKSEFVTEYPDKADAWDELEKGDSEDSASSGNWAETGPFHVGGRKDDDYSGESDREGYFYDRNRHKIRVVHCEYKCPVKRHFMTNPETGMSEPLTEEQVSLVKEMQRNGQLEGAEIQDTWAEEVYTLEFVGSEVLWKSTADNPYQPYDGFSVVPFTCYLDDETRTPYGMIRNLFDPQMEVNKARSVTLEQLADQPKPGMMAESDSVEDPDVFDNQLHTSGETAWVKPGALAAGKLMPLPLPQVSPAAVERLQTSLELFERIANVETEVGNPAAQAEAAATHFLRYHRSRLGQRPIIANFERGQRGVKRRVVESILRVMPDHQIATLIGNDEEYAIQGGTLITLEPHPETGEPMPVKQVPLRGMRDLRYDIALETTSENTMLNMLEHQGLLGLHQAGVPVPPDLLAEGATTSRSKRDELRKYAKETSASQAAAAQRMQEAEIQKIGGILSVENAKTVEQRRHNIEQEHLDFVKHASDEQLEFLKVWEKADANEKQALLDMAKIIEQRQARRETPQLRALPGGSNGS